MSWLFAFSHLYFYVLQNIQSSSKNVKKSYLANGSEGAYRFAVVVAHWFCRRRGYQREDRTAGCWSFLLAPRSSSFSLVSRPLFHKRASFSLCSITYLRGAQLYKIITHGWQVKGAIWCEYRVGVVAFRSCVCIYGDDFISQPSSIARMQEERPSLVVRVSISLSWSMVNAITVYLLSKIYIVHEYLH